MSAIPVNFDGKQDDPNWTPQPPPGRKGTSFVLPPDCKVAFTQRLLRKGPKIFSLTGREREADGLVVVWDEHAGRTLYKCKMDTKGRMLSVYREPQHAASSSAKIASMSLDGKGGIGTDKSDMTLPSGESGTVGSVFGRSGGFLFKGNSRTFRTEAGTCKWKSQPIHPELPELGLFFELQDEQRNVLASTQRYDETVDGHPLDEDADQYPIYLTPACYPILDTVVSSILCLERLP